MNRRVFTIISGSADMNTRSKAVPTGKADTVAAE